MKITIKGIARGLALTFAAWIAVRYLQENPNSWDALTTIVAGAAWLLASVTGWNYTLLNTETS